MEAVTSCVSRWKKSRRNSMIDCSFIKRFFALLLRKCYAVAAGPGNTLWSLPKKFGCLSTRLEFKLTKILKKEK